MTDIKQFLSIEEILAGGEQSYREVPIKSLSKNGQPGLVRVKMMSAGAALAFGDRMDALGENPDNKLWIPLMVELIANALVDEHGQPLFTKEQVQRLNEVKMDAFTELAEAAMNSMKFGEEGSGNA